MEVVYEGILELGYNVTSKSSKDWNPRLFVLKYHPSTKRSTLDFYKNTNKRWQKQSVKGVLSLWPSFELSLAHQCSYKYTLRLSTHERTVYLACNSPQSMNRWFYFIQTQQIMNPSKDHLIFNVAAQDSDSMSMIGATGDCLLVLTPDFEVHCVLLPKKQIVAIWPFECLRSYSYGNNLFSIEAGRHSPHGPGDYSFITSDDKLIHDQIERLIKKGRRGSGTSESSSRFSMADRPPAMLPNDDTSSESPVSTGNSDSDLEHADNSHQNNAMNLDNVFGTALCPEDELAGRPPPIPGMPPRLPPKGLAKRTTLDSNSDWLSSRFGPSLQQRQAPVGSESSEDHLYSHTLHRGSGVSEPLSPTSIYNSLVREGASSTASPTKNEKMVYDVAYPNQGPAQNPDYDVAYTKERVSPPARTKDETDFASPQPPKFEERGMAANPLYGSQSNFLEDSAQRVIETSPLSSPHSKQHSSSPPVQHETEPKADVPDVTANPVYVTSTVGGEQPLTMSACQLASPPAASVTSTSSQHTTLPHSNGVEQMISDASDSKVYTPEKDFKGYTKINKTSVSPVPQILERNHNGDPPSGSDSNESYPVSSSLESEPPQVPERLYDVDC